MSQEPYVAGPHPLAQPDHANNLALGARKWLRLGEPLGSITGLPPWAGAPLSGALTGLAAGALFAGGRNLMRDPEERSSWKKPLLIGGTAGLGLGILSAYLQGKEKQNSSYPDGMHKVEEIIGRDRQLSFGDKDKLIAAIRQSPAHQRARIIELALVGSLTAALAARILGLGWVGSSLAGLGATHLYHQYTRRPTLV